MCFGQGFIPFVSPTSQAERKPKRKSGHMLGMSHRIALFTGGLAAENSRRTCHAPLHVLVVSWDSASQGWTTIPRQRMSTRNAKPRTPSHILLPRMLHLPLQPTALSCFGSLGFCKISCLISLRPIIKRNALPGEEEGDRRCGGTPKGEGKKDAR